MLCLVCSTLTLQPVDDDGRIQSPRWQSGRFRPTRSVICRKKSSGAHRICSYCKSICDRHWCTFGRSENPACLHRLYPFFQIGYVSCVCRTQCNLNAVCNELLHESHREKVNIRHPVSSTFLLEAEVERPSEHSTTSMSADVLSGLRLFTLYARFTLNFVLP